MREFCLVKVPGSVSASTLWNRSLRMARPYPGARAPATAPRQRGAGGCSGPRLAGALPAAGSTGAVDATGDAAGRDCRRGVRGAGAVNAEISSSVWPEVPRFQLVVVDVLGALVGVQVRVRGGVELVQLGVGGQHRRDVVGVLGVQHQPPRPGEQDQRRRRR